MDNNNKQNVLKFGAFLNIVNKRNCSSIVSKLNKSDHKYLLTSWTIWRYVFTIGNYFILYLYVPKNKHNFFNAGTCGRNTRTLAQLFNLIIINVDVTC